MGAQMQRHMADEISTIEPAAPAAGAARGWFPSPLRLFFVTGAVFALVGLGAVPLLLSDPGRLSRLVAAAVPGLDADVTIGTARVGWLGPLILEDVRVVPRNGAVEPLRIARIEGSHGLLAMLLSWGDVGRMRLVGVEGHLAFDEQRRSNLVDLVVPRENAGASPAAGPRRSAVRVRLEADDAVLRITGPWTAEPWVSEPIRLRARLAHNDDATTSEWTIEPVEVFTDARMEPGVAQGVLAYVAPVLADATRTAGRFSLRIDGATFPVGDPGGATLAGKLAMHEVVLGPGPLVMGVFAALPGRLPAPPTVRIADESHVTFRLENERVWHEGLEFGVPLAKPGQRLDVTSRGWVSLRDGAMDLTLSLPIPADLPQDRPLIAALAGKTLSVGIAGELGKPRVNFDGSIRATAGDFVADLLDRLRADAAGGSGARAPGAPRPFPAPRPPTGSRNSPEAETSSGREAAIPGAAAPTAQPTPNGPQAGDVIDLVGGVLDEVARRRAERRAAAADGEGATESSRTGGLLRGRLRRLVPVPTSPAATPEPPAE